MYEQRLYQRIRDKLCSREARDYLLWTLLSTRSVLNMEYQAEKRICQNCKNNFVIEHNPTIVQFSPNSLSMPSNPHEMSDSSPVYNLVANVYCTFPNDADRSEKSFGVHLKCPATDSWLEIENLSVRETEAQMLFMSESYIQIWELQ